MFHIQQGYHIRTMVQFYSNLQVTCWSKEFPCIPMKNLGYISDPSCSLMHDTPLQHTPQGPIGHCYAQIVGKMGFIHKPLHVKIENETYSLPAYVFH